MKLNLWYEEVIEKLKEIFSFHLQTSMVQQHYSGTQIREDNALEPTTEVIAAKPLTHLALCHYLTIRKIYFEIAEKNSLEVYYEPLAILNILEV